MAKKNPFPKGFTIDKDSLAVYHTPKMERRIQEERKKDEKKEKQDARNKK